MATISGPRLINGMHRRICTTLGALPLALARRNPNSITAPSTHHPQSIPPSSFHTSCLLSSRYPPLPVSFSKRARTKILARQEKLRMKYGPNRNIRNPLAPPPAEPAKFILPFLATTCGAQGRGNRLPLATEIVPGKPWESLQLYRRQQGTKADAAAVMSSSSSSASDASPTRTSDDPPPTSIRHRTKKAIDQAPSSRNLNLPPQIIPDAIVPSPLPPSIPLSPPTPIPALSTLKPPFYAYNLTPSDITLLLKETPLATELYDKGLECRTVPNRSSLSERAEMVRRLISLDNANSKSLKQFNVKRCIEMFGKHVGDCGSADVQAAIFTVRIHAMEEHLKGEGKKDMASKRQLQVWKSKRVGILRYLRRTDLERFVQTCRLIGVEPDSVVETDIYKTYSFTDVTEHFGKESLGDENYKQGYANNDYTYGAEQYGKGHGHKETRDHMYGAEEYDQGYDHDGKDGFGEGPKTPLGARWKVWQPYSCAPSPHRRKEPTQRNSRKGLLDYAAGVPGHIIFRGHTMSRIKMRGSDMNCLEALSSIRNKAGLNH
ncbi:hypothetical protein SeMB42_g02830 [Synchytrium endobioticum]|uniref:Ribosomal protein S15 n=1 Tax=Synchytrium endobioticum TaxID=286115 RepID=A0A507DD59_9FUNG|nr:hypothetical protein SeMB42_g02830 [Synchytrium endobioticum]